MVVTVIYPKSANSTFDHEYYAQHHMPLVQRLWGAHDMKAAKVLRGTGGLGGDPTYEVITILEFPSQETWLKASGAHADEIMRDVPHFTNIRPIVQFNEWVA